MSAIRAWTYDEMAALAALVGPTCPCCGSPIIDGVDPHVLDAGELAYTAQLIADGTVADRRVKA